MKSFILIGGKRNVGKDYIASHLNNIIPGSQVVHFADAVKYEYAETVLKDLSLGRKLIDDRDFKELHRLGLIELSQHQKMVHGNDYWVNKLLEYCSDPLVYIIPDLRFKPELFSQKFTADNCIKIKIIASDLVRASRGWHFTQGIDDHVSETDLDDLDLYHFDIIFNNNGKSLNTFTQIVRQTI